MVKLRSVDHAEAKKTPMNRATKNSSSRPTYCSLHTFKSYFRIKCVIAIAVGRKSNDKIAWFVFIQNITTLVQIKNRDY